MSILRSTHRLFVPTLMTAAIVAACGGGGGGEAASQLRQVPDAAKPAADGTVTTMSCVGGNADNLCSGDAVLRTHSGVRLTSSGVFVYGQSTTDGVVANDATGLNPVSAEDAAVAEIRVHRASGGGAVDGAAMLLSDVGITWNGTDQRPRIIEAFERRTKGVTELDGTGAIVTSRALPPATDTSYYNYVPLTGAGTPENYANNRYFECPTLPCDPTLVETTGVSYVAGDFRTTGTDPDRTTAHRNHSDGDVRAPDGLPQPDAKGFRDLTVYSYLAANLAAWETKDTTFINEWKTSGATTEQSTRRSGIVAFGNTTVSANVPTSGEGTYSGIAYGWYTPDGTAAPIRYLAAVSVVVNFGSTRQADVSIKNAVAEVGGALVPVAIVARAAFGDTGTNVANYLQGRIDDGGTTQLTQGGLGARFFDTSATEIAGSFNLKNATTGAATIGGFIARR